MSFIPLNMDDVKEKSAVPAGRYDLLVTEVDTEAKTKEGKPQWILSIAIVGHELTAPNVRHYVGIPSDKDNAEQRNFKLLNIKRMNQLFGIEVAGLDSEQLLGKTVNAELSLSEPDEQGRVFNRLVLPFLKREGSAPKPPSAPAQKKR